MNGKIDSEEKGEQATVKDILSKKAPKPLQIVLVSFDLVETVVHAGLAYLGAVLKQKGHTVRILDTSHLDTPEKVAREFKEHPPDLLGLSFYSTSTSRAYALARRIKEHVPSCTIVAGGPHPTVSAGEVAGQPDIDFVVIGEGEATLAELSDAIAGGEEQFAHIRGIAFQSADGQVTVTEKRPFIENLDVLPIPDYSLFRMSDILRKTEFPLPAPSLGVIFCRGCPFQCTFCQPTLDKIFGLKTRQMSPERAVEIIAHLKQRYGIRGLSIKDDTFLINREWLEKFCSLLKARNLNIRWKCNGRLNLLERGLLKMLKDAGLVYMTVTFEAGSDRVRNELFKKRVTRQQILDGFAMCKEIGIFSHGNVMIGTPTETEEEIQESIEMVERVKPDSVFVYFTTLMPATYLYEQFQDYVSGSTFIPYRHYSENTRRDVPAEKLWYYQELVTRRNREISLRKFFRSAAYRNVLIYRWWTFLARGEPHRIVGEIMFLSNVDYLLGRKDSVSMKIFDFCNNLVAKVTKVKYGSKV